MASFKIEEPRLPPITRITGLSFSNPQNFLPLSASPFISSLLMGVPVTTALSAGRYCAVSGKLQHIALAAGKLSLFARPGVISDS